MNLPHKILHISKYYFPFRGGTEAVAQDVAEGLTEYQNKVIAFNHESGFKQDVINDIEVIRPHSTAKVASQSLSVSYPFVLRRILKKWQPDAVHFHHPNVFVAFLLNIILPRHIKLVVHWHLDIVKQKLLYKVFKKMEQKLLQRADAIVVTSNSYKNGSAPLSRFLHKVRIIHNGIDPRRFELQESDNQHIASLREKYNHKRIVFFVGRHVPYKGLHLLLKAERLIREDCLVVIAGEGPLTEELKQQTQSSRVVFTGRLSEQALRCHLHLADVFAFPSITKNEAFGLALAEGMYCKCVPVTFTIEGSGVNEVSIHQQTGIEVPNSDVLAYAQAIDKLFADEELRQTYAEAAHKRVCELFTVEKEQNEFRKLYGELLHSHTDASKSSTPSVRTEV